jgi:hypothetical protein
LKTGQPARGALNVEIDAKVTVYAIAESTAILRIWGVSLADIGPASNMNGMTLDIWGGMQPGLPFAKPKQAGLLLHGIIQQCFSNWIGTSMTVDLIVSCDTGKPSNPLNFAVDWKAGQSVQEGITSTLHTAFDAINPNLQLRFNLTTNPALPEDVKGSYRTLREFAGTLVPLSQRLVHKDGYRGIQITMSGNVITIYDNPSKQDAFPIAFTDMIGQPTWIESGIIQLICVMRGDLQVGDLIRLPKSPVITTPNSYSQYPITNRDGSIFQGDHVIQSIRHTGNFRSPNALEWVTIIECYQYHVG